MFFQKYKFTFIFIISFFVCVHSVHHVSGQSVLVRNPHALNLQQRYKYNNDIDKLEKKIHTSDGKSEIINNNIGGSIDDDNIWQSPILDESLEKDEKTSQNKFLWDGKYSLLLLSKVLNHPNGWIKKSSNELLNSRNVPFEFDERRAFADIINPLGDLNHLKYNHERNGKVLNTNLQQLSPTSFNDIIQKRNNNAAFICHFKLCQLGASGKRRFNPGAWNLRSDHEDD